MGRDIPLGRIAGIKVSMSLSVVLVAAYWAYSLATILLPDRAPELSGTAYWVAGASFALLFFASLLVHEIGHALVAQDEGIGVRGISLWLLGGVAKLESSPTTARSEFRIAVVGPLASAACGVVFLVVSYVLPGQGIPGLIGTLFQLLGILNLFLAAFNILPAAPLDGGTVLSSLIWRRTGSQATGMRWSAYAGIVAGGALVITGIQGIRTNGADFEGVVFLFVGGFILYAAARSLQSLPLYTLLDGITVADAMAAGPPVAAGWQTVTDFLRSLPLDTQHQAYPVVGDHGRVTGLLTAAALRAVPTERWDQVRVQDLAFPVDRITVVRPDEPLLPAVQRIDSGDVRDGLVAAADGTILGTVGANALFHTLERRKLALGAGAGG